MPWLNKVHRCALPDIPDYIGPGSTWECGDVGGDVCKAQYIVNEGGLWEPVDGPVVGTATHSQPHTLGSLRLG